MAGEYPLPPDPVTGRRRSTTKRGFRTRKAARQWERENVDAPLAAGEAVTYRSRGPLVSAYIRGWVAGFTAKANTVSDYRNMIEWYIIPHLGGYRLVDLDPEHVDGMYRRLEREGGRRRFKDDAGEWVTEPRPLAAKTVRNVHVVLRRALRTAVERGLVRRNVAALAHPPSSKATRSRKAEEIWTPAQLRTWMGHIADDRLFGPWMLVATTGLRRGEVCGLHWADVDLEQAVARVRWQLTAAGRHVGCHPGSRSRRDRRPPLR